MNTITPGSFDPHRFPAPPDPTIRPTKNGEGLPAGPGIYFVWQEYSIVYVGLSKNLRRRATLAHSRIRDTDTLSFLEFPDHDLERVEAFYIGVIYPRRNIIGRQFPWWLFGRDY